MYITITITVYVWVLHQSHIMLVKCCIRLCQNCLFFYNYVYYLLQFRLSELEEQVFRQLWNALLTQTSLLVSEDFSVDDELDVGPPG